MNRPRLERECRVFARYLMGVDPGPDVIRHYLEAHRLHPGLAAGAGEGFDRVLSGFAALGPPCTRLADAYARLSAPRSALRKKLVLLLAILESCAPSAARIDAVDPGPRLLLLARLAGRGAVSGLAIVAGTLLLLPLQGVTAVLAAVGSWRR